MNLKTEELFNFDQKLNIKNSFVAGVDEAGRGPLAGPVVCACVVMPLDDKKIVLGVNDSKKVSAKKRLQLYDEIKNIAIAYSIVEISEKVIDEINILNATKMGMTKAINNVANEVYKKFGSNIDMVLIDAVKLKDINITQQNIVKGDATSYNIAAASILAKVYRDNLMIEYSKKYPLYGFEAHKGYGTKTHVDNLKKYGKCEIHRNSFIKNFVK